MPQWTRESERSQLQRHAQGPLWRRHPRHRWQRPLQWQSRDPPSCCRGLKRLGCHRERRSGGVPSGGLLRLHHREEPQQPP